MRRNQGFVLLSISIVLVLLAGVLWYVYAQHEASKQEMLQQAAQKFLQEYKDGRVPAPPTAAEVWAAQEQRAQAAAGSASAGTQQRPPFSNPIAQAPATGNRWSLTANQYFPLLSSALLIAALTAVGFAGSTYRLAKQGGAVRLERDRLEQELTKMRSSGPQPNGRPAPPWQEGALMMVRASTVPAIAYDLDARVLEVSEAFTRITGYSRVDMPDVKSWFTKLLRTPDAELEAALEAFRSKVHGGELETRTVWTSSGEARTWLCQPLEVWPLEGDALLLVARATDVTAEAEAARAARAEAESLRVALQEASRTPAPLAESSAGSAREPELAAQLARRDEECEQLKSQVRTLNERLVTEQAELAALRAHDNESARRSESRVSEQQQAAALVESAYRAAASGLCVLDPNLEVTRANDRWQEMARDAGGAQAAVALVAPLARESLRIRSGTRNGNVRVRNAAGAEKAWRIDCHPIIADTGAVSALAITAEDITEQASRIARAQDEVERLRTFAEHLEDGLWIADPRLPRLVYATAQAAKQRGRPLARAMEDFAEWTAAVHEDDRERVRQAFFAAGVEGNYNVEYRVVRDDSSVVWLHDRGVAVRDGQNRLRFLVGITTDVTVRKNAEETTRSTLAILRTLVDHAPAIVWLKDSQGRYLYANREFAKVTGFTAEHLRGKTDFQVFPRAAAERMHANDARAAAANTAQLFEESMQLGDGLHHFVALKFAARDPEAPAGSLGGIAIEVTERRRSEDALRADESRYRAIVAALPQPLLIARENKVVYANAAAAELLGAEADALVGTPLQEFAATPEQALIEAARALTTEEAGRRRFAARIKARDARELEVEVSAAAYETATERAVQFVVQDVGERNAQIRTLQEAESFFHGLCDATPAALRLLDIGGRCIFASRGWEALCGSGADRIWFEQVHPDDRASVRESFAAPPRRDEPVTIEYRLNDGSGRERWIMEVIRARYDAQGHWRGFLSSAIDISERKRTEEALREEKEDLATLLDRCPAPVWVADASGDGYVNRACLAWLGVDPDANRSLDLSEHVHADDRREWQHMRERHANDGTPFDEIFRLRRADGEYRHVHVSAVPIGAAGETGARFVGFLEDVTAYREAAQALAIAEQRQAQIVSLVGSTQGDGLGQVRHTAELIRVMFPEEPQLQEASATVLAETQRLEGLVDAMLEPLRAQGGSRN
jgi:PAS domain S-box-containing protein